MNSKRILLVHRGTADKPAFAAQLEAAGCSIDMMAVPYQLPLRGLPHILGARRDFASYDMIIASEYALVWGLAVRLLRHRRPKLVALGFNLSARPFLTGIGAVDSVLNRIWRRVDRFIVHSREEARLFERTHGIDSGKFSFAHWGFDLPAREISKDEYRFSRFISMIGRNNRDIPTFCEAAALADTAGILVTADYMISADFEPPSNIEVLVDIPMSRCLDIVERSDVHLVLVRDGDRGAGHISAVAAMLLGKPQIFSNVPTITDYLIDGFNGLAVNLHDPQSVAAAIVRLQHDPALAERLGENGRTFAYEWLSADANMRRIAALMLQTLDGRTVDLPDWDIARAEIERLSSEALANSHGSPRYEGAKNI